MQTIPVFNRYSQKVEDELVYGGKWLAWLYQNPKSISLEILVHKIISHWVGIYYSSYLSKAKIKGFVQNYKINMQEYDCPQDISPEQFYLSFNDFFIRSFRPDKRVFDANPDKIVAMSEGRYLGYSCISQQELFDIKSQKTNLKNLLNKSKWSELFFDGPMLISRLCPLDYHKFHYPLDCEVVDQYTVDGILHSVNPWAIKAKPDIFLVNERQITIAYSNKFGYFALIEVGALCVGKIVQKYYPHHLRSKGQEKGHFLFGASTVIMLGQKGYWTPSADILKHTANKQEVFVKLGDEIALSTQKAKI